ncbi:hypothetical protein BH18CHL2_BH18CHL2_06910 [soil metagenome]
MPKNAREPDPDRLVRESAGTYLSEDGRFRVRSDSGGAWYVADKERVNELVLELLLGPLPTVAAARDALARQRAEPSGFAPGDLPEPSRPRREVAAAGVERGPAAEPVPPPKPEPAKPTPALRRAEWRRKGDDRDAVARAFQRINDAWTGGEPEEMAEVLDEHIVIVQPDFADRVEGRDATIASFRDFMASALVHEYVEADLVIELRGATAVVTCGWEIDWQSGEGRQRDRGHDVYVFARERGKWRAVWRLLVPANR